MSAARVSIPLDSSELNALVQMAQAECRHPREQMRFLLREEAQRRGLLRQLTEDTNNAPAVPMPERHV
jgi:hypothetical protein